MNDVAAAGALAHVAARYFPGFALITAEHELFIPVAIAVAGEHQRAIARHKGSARLAQRVRIVARQDDLWLRPGRAAVIGIAHDVRGIIPATQRLRTEMVDALPIAQ